MKQIASLVKRNILVYGRNRMNVFSSLFTMLIIIILMTVFLGDSCKNGIVDMLSSMAPGRDIDADKINAGIYMLNWIVAGILLVNSVTVSLAVVGIMVEDRENNKLNSMYVAPMKRSRFVLAYVITGFIVTFVMGLVTVIASEGIIVMQGGALLSIASFAKLIGVLAVVVLVFSAFSFLCVLAVRSNSAFSTISGLVGTLIGFVAAIYIPIGELPSGIANIIKYLPTMAGSSLFREIYTKDIGNKLFNGIPQDSVVEINKVFGTSLYYGDTEASFMLRMLILIASGIIFLGIGCVFMKRRHLADR